jgi:two-component system, cell cycle sensor histidine kinase and response regulator CckA
MQESHRGRTPNAAQRLSSAAQQPAPRRVGDRYRALVECAPDAVVVTDERGSIILVNSQAERLFGYAPGELVGRPVELLLPEGARAAHRRHRAGYLANPEARTMGADLDLAATRKDGSTFPVDVSLSPLRTDSGGVVVITSVRDITERKRAEEAQRQSEERFRGAFRFAAIGMALVAPDGRFLQVNDALCELVGYSAHELLERGFQEITHPDDLEADLEYVRQLLAGEISTYQMEKRYFHRLGHVVWVLLNVSLVRASDGSPVHFVSQIQDITDRKAAETRLRELELRYRTLVEQLPLAIYSRPLDLDKPNLYVSPQVENMLGYSVEDWVTNPDLLAEIVHPEDRDRVLGDAARLRRTGEPILAEYRYIAKGGHTVWVQDETYLVREDGEQCVQGYLLDISERKQAEEERDRLRDDLHHAQKLDAIGQLAGGIAHDFNNTLTAIRGYGDLLVKALSDDHPLRRYADEIRKTAEAGAALPRQLLAFGRRQPLARESLRLNEVVAESCRLFEPLLGERIELVFEPGPDVVVASDRFQLGQALLNLALNARDAMPEGGRLTVTTQARHLDIATGSRRAGGSEYAVVSVRDTGIGMDASTKGRVFEPFFTTKPDGNGLGLAMLYGIIHQSGGFVTLESEPGAGSTFEIYLPCDAAAVIPQPASEEPDGAGTVLVAEDEPAVRGLVREVLELAGHRVMEAANGAEALAALERHDGEIDALVTDLRMPGMDGLELARRIRIDRPGLPTVAISAYTEESPDENVIFLAKPFSSAELAATVDEALHRAADTAQERPPAEISVVVADDHPPVLDAVTRVLETTGFRVVGTADDGPTALRRIVDRQPDVALVDIRMQGLNGVEVTRRAAELARRTAVVLYTGLGDQELLQQALDAGARGFLLKDASLSEVAHVLTRIADGETYVTPDLADALVTPTAVAELPTLTTREREVLKLLAEGMTNDGAAAALSISPETIQTHVRKAMAKLDADTRTAAVATALRLALIA